MPAIGASCGVVGTDDDAERIPGFPEIIQKRKQYMAIGSFKGRNLGEGLFLMGGFVGSIDVYKDEIAEGKGMYDRTAFARQIGIRFARRARDRDEVHAAGHGQSLHEVQSGNHTALEPCQRGKRRQVECS